MEGLKRKRRGEGVFLRDGLVRNGARWKCQVVVRQRKGVWKGMEGLIALALPTYNHINMSENPLKRSTPLLQPADCFPPEVLLS